MIRARDVSKMFRQHGRDVRALEDVDVEIWPARRSASSASRAAARRRSRACCSAWSRRTPAAVVELDGQRAPRAGDKRTLAQEKALQIVFQNPDSALNRRHSVRR